MVRRLFLFAVTMLAAAASASAACPDFSRSDFGTNQYPWAIASGDFNRDGKVDLVVADGSSPPSVKVYLGDGNGGFTAGASFTPDATVTMIAVGDFNRDGILDLAVVARNANEVQILLGGIDGSGNYTLTQAPGSPLTGMNGVRSIAVGDVNGDGIPDLAIANLTANSVAIMLGNGSGGFTAAPSSPITAGLSEPQAVAFGDLNGDGKLDLVVGNSMTNIVVFDGDGTGGFTSAFTGPFGGGNAAYQIAIADLNRDGRPDIMVVNYTLSGSVAAFLQKSDGTFAAPSFYPVGGYPIDGVVADFNGDGIPDIAVLNSQDNTVSLLVGAGDGTFSAAAASPFSVGVSAFGIAAGDFNGDGKPDLATVNYASYTVSVLLNNGNCVGNACGLFPQTPNLLNPDNTPVAVATADFNHDGILDLAVVNSGSNDVSILLGNSGGGFGSATNYPVGSSPIAIAVADINGDGNLDLAVVNNSGNSVSILLGNGDGTFKAKTDFPVGTSPSGPQGIAVGDFNRDGKPDLAVSCGTSLQLAVLLNTTTTGSTTPSFSSSSMSVGSGSGPRGVVVADFNRDGKPDVAVADYGDGTNPGRVAILLGNGSGGFASPVYTNAHIGSTSLAFGDFNGDGIPDIAVSNAVSGDVGILIGDGTGAFGSANYYSTGNGAEPSVAAGDFNKDGKLDLAVSNTNGIVSVYKGDGGGHLGNVVNYTTGSVGYGMIAGDFNRDGFLDLAMANEVSTPALVSHVAVLINSCSDLTITKTHTGNFNQGQSGAQYTLTVSNTGGAATDGSAITVSDTLPTGMTATAISGTGINGPAWTCTLSPLGCTSTSVLGGLSDTITVTVNVDPAASSPLTNMATVSGGGEINTANDTASDPTTINLQPDLTVGMTDSGNFAQGQTGATYAITVTNKGVSPTDGTTVTLQDTLPAGLTATAMGGTGWTCSITPAVRCTRSDALAASTSYPVITLTVNIAGNAPTPVMNTATVSGGGDSNASNNTATDSSSVTQRPNLTVTSTHSDPFHQGQIGATYTITVHNIGGAPTTGAVVEMIDTLPAGFSATAMSGSGWNCSLGSTTCTTTAVAAAGSAYPNITLTASVPDNAGSPLTNTTAAVGGGSNTVGNGSDTTTVTPAPDLTILKTHTGNFTQGQSGAPWTLTVTNTGGAATTGIVTVTDTLPAKATATAIGGTGWSCTLASLVCTRSDPLATSSSYPAITVTVTISSDAPATVTNSASVSGGGEFNTSNDSASDTANVNTAGLIPPTNLTATANSTSQVTIGWDAVPYAVKYQVYRTYDNMPLMGLGPAVTTTSLIDTSVTANTTYVYMVEAIGASSSISLPSNFDIATTVMFTDDSIVPGSTVVKAVHLTELRAAIDDVRAATGLGPASYTNAVTPGSIIEAIDITEMRAALDAGRAALPGLPAVQYTDPSLAAGTVIKAAHIQELRNGVK